MALTTRLLFFLQQPIIKFEIFDFADGDELYIGRACFSPAPAAGGAGFYLALTIAFAGRQLSFDV